MLGKAFGFLRWVSLVLMVVGYAVQIWGYSWCTCGHLRKYHPLFFLQCTVDYCTCKRFRKEKADHARR